MVTYIGADLEFVVGMDGIKTWRGFNPSNVTVKTPDAKEAVTHAVGSAAKLFRKQVEKVEEQLFPERYWGAREENRNPAHKEPRTEDRVKEALDEQKWLQDLKVDKTKSERLTWNDLGKKYYFHGYSLHQDNHRVVRDFSFVQKLLSFLEGLEGFSVDDSESETKVTTTLSPGSFYVERQSGPDSKEQLAFLGLDLRSLKFEITSDANFLRDTLLHNMRTIAIILFLMIARTLPKQLTTAQISKVVTSEIFPGPLENLKSKLFKPKHLQTVSDTAQKAILFLLQMKLVESGSESHLQQLEQDPIGYDNDREYRKRIVREYRKRMIETAKSMLQEIAPEV